MSFCGSFSIEIKKTRFRSEKIAERQICNADLKFLCDLFKYKACFKAIKFLRKSLISSSFFLFYFKSSKISSFGSFSLNKSSESSHFSQFSKIKLRKFSNTRNSITNFSKSRSFWNLM